MVAATLIQNNGIRRPELAAALNADRLPSRGLAELAAEANEAHAKAEGAAKTTLQHAIAAGKALTQAKELLPHGEWAGWVKANCRFSNRSAQAYMRIAKNERTLLSKSADACAFEEPTIEGALEAIATPKPAPAAAALKKLCDVPFREWPAEERRHWIHETSWGHDQLIEQPFVLDAMSWSIEQIAELLFVEPRQVRAVLDPQPPVRFDTGANGRDLFPAEQVDGVARLYRENMEIENCATRLRVVFDLECRGEKESLSDDVWAELRAMRRCANRRIEQLNGSDIMTSRIVLDRIDRITLWCLAISDHRAALGIDDVSFPGRLSAWFRKHREDVRSHIEAA